jgi:hypothetical protein
MPEWLDNGMTYRKLIVMRTMVSRLLAATALACGICVPTPAGADPGAASSPAACNSIACLPGVTRDVVKGTPCPDPNYYVFAVTGEGQLFFCGSPRGFSPRYFRSPELAGIRNLGDSCEREFNRVAQAPDGLYLLCAFTNADEQSHWVPGNYSDYRKAY